ncbi:hypothetical protein CI105_01200 [Candidatus Izimaplasma bacterium ZiA1]|uniref:immunoglobulin-like domain-containing protein n=1 Tax=Candidatus Izimoplasma sp. ZiA1 TaxID=2024899 RepID=UPI000BAA6C5D|nr:hypothetical protein CI105_01200 [Candidatus Izimaplasma bacterium ZiA1]
MKKVLTFALLFLAVFSLSACKKDDGGLTATQKIEEALLVVNISGRDEVVADLDLILTSTHDTTVTWSSSDTDVISNDGTVTRPAFGENNVTVTLTASITLDGTTLTKEIEVRVMAMTVAPPPVKTVSEIYGLDNEDTFDVTGIVYSHSHYGFFISDGTGSIFVFGPDYKEDFAEGSIVNILGEKDAYHGAPQISVISMKEATGEFTVPTVINGSVGTLKNNLVDFGTKVVLTGTIEKVVDGTFTDVFITDAAGTVFKLYYKHLDVISTFDGKTVTLELVHYSKEEALFLGEATDVTEITAFTDAHIVAAYKDGLSIGSVDFVTGNLDLFTSIEGVDGLTIAWATSDALVVETDGTVHGVNGQDLTATLTATITKGDSSATVTFDVTVVDLAAITTNTVAEVNAATDGDFVKVLATVTGIFGKGYFLNDGTDDVQVYLGSYPTGIEIGDQVTVIGYRSTNYSVPQISDVAFTNVESSDNTLPVATDTTIANLFTEVAATTDMYGQLITFTGTVGLFGSYNNVIISDANDNDVMVYFRSDSFSQTVLKMFVGKDVTVTANVYSYHSGDGQWQVIISDVKDLTAMTGDDTENADIIGNYIIGEVAANVTEPGDLELITTMGSFATITWASSDAAVITDAGMVMQHATDDKTATLTATVVVGAVTKTYTVDVNVVSELNASTPATVSDAILLDDTVTTKVVGVVVAIQDDPNGWSGFFIQDSTGKALFVDLGTYTGVEVGDEVVLQGELDTMDSWGDDTRYIKDAELISDNDGANAVVVNAETDPAVIAAGYADLEGQKFVADLTFVSADAAYAYFQGVTDGAMFKLNHAVYGPYTQFLTAGNILAGVEFVVYDMDYDNVRVVAVTLPAPTDQQIADTLYGAAMLPNDVYGNLVLATTHTDYTATAVWTTNNLPVVAADGTVVRPALNQPDVDVLVSVVVTVNSVDYNYSKTVTVKAYVPELFFSEYAEADGGNCKYVEVYNPTSEVVQLSNYKIIKGGNGKEFAASSDIYEMEGTLAPGAVVVVGNSGCINATDDAQDPLVSSPLFPTTGIAWYETTVVGYVNGDDALGLFKGDALVDTIGLSGEDPGSKWDVGNGNTTDGTTANVILVRVSTVVYGTTDWTVGAEQWIVSANDRDYSTVGSHTSDLPVA